MALLKDYILVSKHHRNSNVRSSSYEDTETYFLNMFLEHGLKHVIFSELEIPLDHNLFSIEDKIKALKFVFDNPDFVTKPDKKFKL